MLAWLEKELIDAEKNNQNVFIIGHMVNINCFLLKLNYIINKARR